MQLLPEQMLHMSRACEKTPDMEDGTVHVCQLFTCPLQEL